MATKFKLGINMAGAVSAGAYTAGVLDFLMEALEEWQKTKDTFRAYLANPTPGPVPPVAPLHEVEIDVFCGTSAGGMCAAIAAVMVQQAFQHIQTGDEQGTTNTFYESWVNKIDISELLKDQDITENGALMSLLDCTILDKIADYALTPNTTVVRQPYISDSLTLFLTLTNTRGVPYKLYSDASASTEENTAYYGDRLRFETTAGGAAPQSPTAKPLPAGQPGAGAWPLLKDVAKATGAVPVALASRVLQRDLIDYSVPGWEPLCADSAPLAPNFPKDMPMPYKAVYVDGGVTNDDPFQLAHDFLAAGKPNCQNPRPPEEADAAVLTVAPFPIEDDFTSTYKPEEHQDIWSILGSSINVMLSQSRFLGESLPLLMSGVSFSRFVIAPSDANIEAGNVLQCSALGAFGGFFSREFRKHDFLLGRRNCQQFLRTRFALVDTNPIIAEGLTEAGAYAAQIKNQFLINAPNKIVLPQGKVWMPIIPLCGSATAEVAEPVRVKMQESDVDAIVEQIIFRLNAIRSKLAPGKLGELLSGVIGFLLHTWIVDGKVREALKEALMEGLGDNVAQEADAGKD